LTNRTESDSESKAWFHRLQPQARQSHGKHRLVAGAAAGCTRPSADELELPPQCQGQLRDATARSLSVHTNRIL